MSCEERNASSRLANFAAAVEAVKVSSARWPMPAEGGENFSCSFRVERDSMSTMQDVDGIIILGLALMAVTVASALRGLYSRSQIPFFAKKAGHEPADRATVLPLPSQNASQQRKAA
jgi:hypothetical protein